MSDVPPPKVEVPEETTSKQAPASSGASSGASKPGFNQELLIKTVQTLQFAWFVGHLLTLTGIFFYSLTYIKIGVRAYKFWYTVALFGILESFGILIFQIFQKSGSNVFSVLKNDNSQFFLLSAALLFLRPYVLLTLLPFALYSVFHSLAYIQTYLLPVFGLDKHAISKTIGDFVANNNVKSVQLGSVIEVYAYVWLFVRLLTFRRRSLVPFVVYTVFIKTRFENSIFTRNYIKSIEVKVDSLVNSVNVPAVKQGWTTFKHTVRKTGDFYLVNDYTKEKLT
ncbi:uncharacterized protein CANTADRAFT_46909 [Suhomyces tanzawaensis NRRL Y-17324]|uniref:Pore membrane protein of 33 kDa n=1 Tax=Suhomyces tanzawaensis NRRL Y-17324 TaxID=984487 RepID=A0A1E4SMZ3_9ASCO|nr:uncharacterized protein CANTADRAFT_46909 [Suhomyces tanzawaensis NRRL Y-17324]ODV80865.1 hypothetical protein CANTADRAFT_46909 [Suhomyces tanzawaensis NRRL Y-17324]